MASWALKASAVSGNLDGAGGPYKAPHATTVDGRGSDLYLVWAAYYDGVSIAAADLSDVSGNSYNLLTPLATSGDPRNKGTWFYKLSPATSAVEQWTLTSGSGGGAQFGGIAAMAFSGSDGATAPSTASNGTTSQTPTGGSIGVAGQLVVSGATFYTGDTSSIDSSFQIAQHSVYTPSENIGLGVAWQNLVGGIASAANPQWTLTAAPTASGVYNLAFTPSGGAGGGRGLFRTPPVSGIGIGGSFFRDPLQAREQMVRRDRIYVPERYAA